MRRIWKDPAISIEPPDAETEPLDPAPVKEATPKNIGPYKILQVLGEGGMGVVCLAGPTEPIRRRVALKLIKLGMDTKQVIARFESERQALALMNHANIARVFDAGATVQGRPYFVMEYVEGMPITECCDKHRLTTHERLRLFVQVCEGVQHAHQKGIIHRDIKPSNVLTKTEGDKHIPKIIDFGVAKATGQHLTDATMYTQLGQPVGTLEYMSPEQAEMSGLGIDTRTDVYSLGVLLYELLIGAKPFSVKESHLAGFDDWRRKIRDEDAPKASIRLGTLGDASSAAVKNRRTDVSGLLRQLRGDLDWVLMKALEKDRTRRYASASELAADIERHLANQPVLARPPSAMYRFRKFTRRHRAGVAAAALIVLALGIGVAGTSIALVQAVRAEPDRPGSRARGTSATPEGVKCSKSGPNRTEADRVSSLGKGADHKCVRPGGCLGAIPPPRAPKIQRQCGSSLAASPLPPQCFCGWLDLGLARTSRPRRIERQTRQRDACML